MSAHAKRFSPSSLHRQMNCPGCANACANIPRKPSSSYAMEGTIVHQLGSLCLTYDKNPEEFKGWWGWNSSDGKIDKIQKVHPVKTVKSDMVKQIDDKMIEDIYWYLNAIRASRRAMPSAIYKVEEKMDLSWLIPGVFGTGDHLLLQMLGQGIVDDYKNGFTLVEVKENPQFLAYALMAMGPENHYMIEEWILRVTQPNGFHPDGSVREWGISTDDLYTWGYDVLRPAYEASLKPDAPLIAGAWCKWCDNETNCPALREKSVTTMFGKPVTVGEATPPIIDVHSMTGAQLDHNLALVTMVDVWKKAVLAEAELRLESGHADAPRTVKMIAGKLSNRAWKNVATLPTSLSGFLNDSEIYEPQKVKSVVGIESALKAKGHKPAAAATMIKPLLAERKPGKPSMVPVTTNKPALPPKAQRMFKQGE